VRPQARTLIHRITAAAHPSRPWLQLTVSPRTARFLVAAGARLGTMHVVKGTATSAFGQVDCF
jgi:hypothetical protein